MYKFSMYIWELMLHLLELWQFIRLITTTY